MKKGVSVNVTTQLPLSVVNQLRKQIYSLPPSKRPSMSSLIRECVLAHVAREKEKSHLRGDK
jgi:hypothetical protein